MSKREARLIHDEVAVRWSELMDFERRDIRREWGNFTEDFLSKTRWLKIVYGKEQKCFRYEAVYKSKKIIKRVIK